MPVRIYKIKHEKGFTLVETIVVIAIVTVLTGAGLFVGLGNYQSYSLSMERSMVSSLLARARGRALNNIGGEPHGLYIDAGGGKYVLFRGSVYNPLSSDNEEYDKEDAVDVSGLNEVVFYQLTGDASIEGDIMLSVEGRTATISINYEGRIN